MRYYPLLQVQLRYDFRFSPHSWDMKKEISRLQYAQKLQSAADENQELL